MDRAEFEAEGDRLLAAADSEGVLLRLLRTVKAQKGIKVEYAFSEIPPE
jgi:hypothetical protein